MPIENATTLTAMQKHSKKETFNVLGNDLDGSNLIEASAGTGKTYSIAILVLRLILEKNIPVNEILMVTFTNAAVAELQDRIRQYVRMAYKCLSEEIEIEDIKSIVQKAIDCTSPGNVEQCLKMAVLMLDETAVQTIHSFCQQTLGECAFETDQLFGAELMTDDKTIIENNVNAFWRSQIATLPVPLIELLELDGLQRTSLVNLVSNRLAGKEYGKQSRSNHAKTCAELYKDLINEIKSSEDELRRRATGQAARLQPFINPAEVFLEKVLSTYFKNRNNPKHYIHQFSDVIEKCLALLPALYSNASDRIIKEVAAAKQQNSQLQYDDLILNVHKAIVIEKEASLLEVLNEKYKAVFIDEFQDTDKHQFEIFHTAFHEKAIVFYIGDPKQSIYGFRKADLSVYFKAASLVKDRCYTMDVNHRSSGSLVEAMNAFFAVEDAFHYKGEPDAITYQAVKPSGKKKDNFYKEGKPDVPITVYTVQKKDQIHDSVAAQVRRLLDPAVYSFTEDDKTSPIKPSDIGILVRSHYEAKDIKNALAKLGIPSVTVDETKVLQSGEAVYVLYFLEACTDVKRSTINRALLSPFTGLTSSGILQLKEDEVFTRFKDYSRSFQKDGVYRVLSQFVQDYGVRSLLPQRENGDRMLTNLLHLAELLHKVQTQKKYSPFELVCWLKRGIEGGEAEGDEFEQRMESDEEAVKIVTIHKSKGLEYKIVFAPYLDLKTEVKTKQAFCNFKENDRYLVAETKKLTPKQQILYRRQEEQENRRLIYVAITRAVYKCYLYKIPSEDEKGKAVITSLSPFFEGCTGIAENLLEVKEALAATTERYKAKGEAEAVPPPREVTFQLAQKNWHKMSFSWLAAKGHAASTKPGETIIEGYDDFVFGQLRKGEKTGLMLHYIFEHIDFSDEQTWDEVIQAAVKRFPMGKEKDFTVPLKELLHHVLGTVVSCDGQTFQLKEISRQKRLNEFEFDFNVKPFALEKLKEALEKEGVRFKYENQKDLEGVMYGLMDMFFEHKGRFYLLDWKSNHLGYAVEDYKREALENAMRENNYHLQYLLYTLAAEKFLESRLGQGAFENQFGGVIYLFVRGVRLDRAEGIFTCKPDQELLKNIDELLIPKKAVSSVQEQSAETVGEVVL